MNVVLDEAEEIYLKDSGKAKKAGDRVTLGKIALLSSLPLLLTLHG